MSCGWGQSLSATFFHEQEAEKKVAKKPFSSFQPIDTPTPIQVQAIPVALGGRDLLGIAQTGTGKTAAFAIPVIQKLNQPQSKGKKREIKALILTPTRELAIQIDECFSDYAKYTDLRHTVIFGGANQKPQVDSLRRGTDILTATPGRLLDLIGQSYISLNHINFFILDEADRMLDMGFIHDIKRLLPMLPKHRQTLFFSATMPQAISNLSKSILYNPVRVGKTNVIIATDIAARGIDIDNLDMVINYDLPDVAETYIHRIGRTGRAGKGGTALTFCTQEEYVMIKDIQKLMGKKLDTVMTA